MLGLIKKIKLQSVLSGSIKKYLLYAIGEIILIVIGILVAFQIEKLTTASKNKVIEMQVLVDLKTEFELNMQRLEEATEVSSSIVLNSKKLLKECLKDSSHNDEMQITELIQSSIMHSEQIFKNDNSVLTEIVSTGKQSLIRDKEIRTLISSWNNQIEIIKYQEGVVDEFRHKAIDIYLEIGSVPVLNGEINRPEKVNGRSNLPVLESNSFENALGIYLGTSRYLVDKRYHHLKNEISKAIELIDESLKKNR